MIKTCSTCVHWESTNRYPGDPTKICGRVDQWKSDIVFQLWARADDDSGLQVALETGPDFGCILHLELPTANR